MEEKSKVTEEKQKILIVDDSEMNRSILSEMLADTYELEEASDGLEAVNYLRSHLYDISLVFLDIVMPRMDGLVVLDIMNKFKWIEEVPVIIISADAASEHVERAYELGAVDFIQRPFDTLAVRRRAANTIMLYGKQKKLTQLVEEQVYAREKEQSLMVNVLSQALEFRGGEGSFHILRIRTLTDLLLRNLIRETDRYPLKAQDISDIVTASVLHDIGKIFIDDHIVKKPDKLTAEEMELARSHAARGADIIKEMPSYNTEKLLHVAYQICRWHHERYDGNGYPDHLKGDKIPIAAQAVGMADVYDALTSTRPYKKEFTHQEAISMILSGECGAFNPILLKVLERIADSLPIQLKLSSMNSIKEWGIAKLMREIVTDKKVSSSSRAVEMLEQERSKFRFVAENSTGVVFEFFPEPPTVTLAGAGLKSFRVDPMIVHPARDEKLLSVMAKEDMEAVYALFRAATPENPVTEYACTLTHADGKKADYRITALAQFHYKLNGEYILTGAYGKIQKQ